MEHTSNLFIQLAIVLGLSSIFGFFVRLMKLPLLAAYLLAGVTLASLQLFDIHASEALTFLPEIGIAFVLFFIGMELDLKELKALGKPILVAGLGQIIIASLAGYAIAGFLGFAQTESIFLGIGLSVSSTIVVVKMLLEKKELGSLYGKLALGILLLEDVVSVIILMVLTVGSSFLQTGLQSSMPLLALSLKGIALFTLALYLSNHLLTRLFQAVAKSAELLFLTALAWCFIFVAVALFLGFSVVIGAFLAGVALANSPFHFEIQGKVKPLRDFFVALFFVYLGTQVAFNNILEVLPLVLILTLFALVAKPLIFILLLGLFGFKRHTMFQTGIVLSQISEFSLIIMLVGLKMGSVSQPALTAMALTGVTSIILSSIMISYSKQIYRFLGPFIKFFEHSKLVHEIEERKTEEILEHVILIGVHRMGGRLANFLQAEKVPFLAVDFNPKVVKELTAQKVNVLYGDAGDPEILDFLNLEQAKLIISTVPDMNDNQILLTELKKRKVEAAVVVRTSTVEEAKLLYKMGADYVILPEVVAGDFVLQMFKSHWPRVEFFKDRAKFELERLQKNHLLVS